VSRHPIYDLMRNYLTLSWACFLKDIQSHTLQISKILSHPAPHAGDIIKLNTSATVKSDAASAGGPDTSLEVGRLLCWLNFLMIESGLWRDKFVTFEQYAKKLSLEANELRSKVNKEQQEMKRLSGLVTMTTVEKMKLQNRKTHVL